MRNVFVFGLGFLALFPAVDAVAQQTGRQAAVLTLEDPETRLDALFAELKRAQNENAAKRISSRIVKQWSLSGSANIDLLMQWAQKAMEADKTDVALDLLDQVVTLAPDYAEGWNRRATLHFMKQDYAKAMADIGHVLELEPRHFGALAGMAEILREDDRKEAALRAYQRLLDIYPMMREAQTELGKLADELAGQGI
ncbi:tetratricopeptide repeat protein [Aquamicrobium zhengzhouense]|uniref:Tetratricopeptide repeat protein n=1 Tax=Aquamicrobium zhengzhouense TaxID=2781738 RepID=A0ABS0SH14_9HYPH|nr:tetratricopeptide repeat protein [Aquamicrobium zhengzhouense]MBI1622531.1 tetratricopeptide repeat protein [Aquamicrobium zhengzhouense]